MRVSSAVLAVRGRRPGRGEVHPGREDAAVVGAVVEDAGVRDRVPEHLRVEGPEVGALAAVGVEPGLDHRLVRPRPRTGRAVTGGDADGAVTAAGVGAAAGRGRLGDRHEQVVAVGRAAEHHLGRPEGGRRVDPGRQRAAARGERVTHVGPVDQVGRHHGRDAVEDRVAVGVDVVVVQRVGRAVEVPDLLAVPPLAVLALQHGRVGAAVDRAVAGHLRGERVGVAGGDRVRGLPLAGVAVPAGPDRSRLSSCEP